MKWTGRIVTTLVVLFLVFDAAIKFTTGPAMAESFQQLGWPMKMGPVLGIIEIVCLILYLIPRTSLIGAILWTGYLGGAIATHLRIENPLFSHILFPTYVAAFLWGGLLLRDEQLRAFLFARKTTATA